MRQACVSKAKRIVVKVGSAVITTETGRLDRAQIKSITRQIAELKNKGFEVVLVTSGAIAAGLESLGLKQRPTTIPELQATASVGQGLLMHQYTTDARSYSVGVGQVLLTQYDITHREHYVNAANTFEKLLEYGVVPVVNENDTTVVEEIKYGDNDTLAALVTNLVKADALVIMSDVDGLHTADPRKHEDTVVLAEVAEVTREIEQLAGGAGTEFGSGGMVTKLNAAKIVTLAGAGMFLINGRREESLVEAMNGAEIGTFFAPRGRKMTSRKAWIAFGTVAKGTITVDDGAKKALLKNGKSLLPAGVTEVAGLFDDGDMVEITDAAGELLARGLVNYDAEDLAKVKGMTSAEIKATNGTLSGREVIHRDCLVILK
jgi:glutamate 5-kinase